LYRQRRARAVYCKRCEQILDILHNRDRKLSPRLFDKSVLDLYRHLMEHTVADSRVQEMRLICIELIESRNLHAGDS
jgi:hypothetical protein